MNKGRDVPQTSFSALRAWMENALNRLNSTINGMDSVWDLGVRRVDYDRR